MTYSNSSAAIEALAAEIGEKVYIDVAKWHLYLNDAHLHTLLAERLYPRLAEGIIQENDIIQILRDIPVKVGGGKRELPLSDLLPMQSQVHLMDVVEEFQHNI